MKLVVWFLLLANVLLFAYFNLPNPPAPVMANHQPISPDKVKLMSKADIEALPRNAVATSESSVSQAPPLQIGCYEWGSFSTASLPRAQSVLAKFSLQSTTNLKTPQEATRYWVYIPRLGSLQAAQAKVQELKGLGVEVSFIVQEPQWRNAISLGVFKDEQLASKLLEELKAKGVRTAVKGPRNQEKGQSSLYIANMSSETAQEIDKLKPDFPGSELKPVTCQ